MIYRLLFCKPFVESLMSHSNSECIYSYKFSAFFLIVYGDTFSAIFVLPMKMCFSISRLREYPAIGLIFDIKELGAVKPMSGIVMHWISANCLSHYFAHHSTGVPHSLHSFSITYCFMSVSYTHLR